MRPLQLPDPRRVARRIESWFARHQRALPWRDSYVPYHVWVSEVMLQQTRMEVVLPYFTRFLERFPTVDALARATDDEVTAAWSGLGYYRRARMLRAAAAVVVERFGGRVPDSVEILRSLPGIGRYTAGAIASVAWNRPAPIVDGNVARILTRLFALEAPLGSGALEREAWRLAAVLVDACRVPRDFNQGLMEVGALLCRPRNPLCTRCPVRPVCAAFTTGRVDELPRPARSKPVRRLRVVLFVVRDRHGRILMQRAGGRLMHRMLHLPHGDTTLLEGAGVGASPRALLGTFRHTITDRRIEFEVWSASLRRGTASRSGLVWVDPAGLAEHPHPSYVRKALRIALPDHESERHGPRAAGGGT